MPGIPYSQETKQQLREAVMSGKSRQQTLAEFGVSLATACRWTVDLPKKGLAAKRLTPGEKENLRKLVAGGMSKHQASMETGISYPYVMWLTRDMPNAPSGNTNIRPKDVEILKELLKEGYFILDNRITIIRYRTLSQHFPLGKVSFSTKTVIFLEDRKEEAFRGFIRHVGSKVVTFNKLTELAGLFGVPLDAKMRKELFGKNLENKDKLLKMSAITKRTERRLKWENKGFVGSYLLKDLLWLRKDSSC